MKTPSSRTVAARLAKKRLIVDAKKGLPPPTSPRRFVYSAPRKTS